MNYLMQSLRGRLLQRGPKLLLVVLWLISSATIHLDETMADWDKLPAVLQSIRPPSFSHRDFSVLDFGAKPNASFNSLPAISEAIEQCHQAGGGRVVVPAGDWYLAGPIHLKSNVNLHLHKDATLQFSTQPEDYLPHVMTRFEGTELMNYSPLIYAFEQENIAITGEGTFDGQARAHHWWHWKGKWGGSVETGWKPGDPDQKKAIAELGEMAEAGVTPKKEFLARAASFVPTLCSRIGARTCSLKESPSSIRPCGS